MLGLNAAIEAARVGALGKEFGVVATEIRKLSESSKETTSSITEIKNISFLFIIFNINFNLALLIAFFILFSSKASSILFI